MQLIKQYQTNFVSLRCAGYLIAAIALCAVFSHSAHAVTKSTCTLGTASNDILNVIVPEIDPTLEIGDSITGGVVTFSSITVANCTLTNATNTITDTLTATGTRVASLAMKQTFATNVSGIGIQIGMYGTFTTSASQTGSGNFDDWITQGNAYDGVLTGILGTGDTSLAIQPEINLIKTSDEIGSGTLSGVVANYVVYPNSNRDSSVQVNYVLNGTIQPSGCVISGGQDLNITLDDVEKKDLPNQGSTWGESSPENIQLICNKGSNVYITFSGTQSADSSDASILQNNGTAEGIGVQLLNGNGDVYQLGEKVSAVTDSGTTVTIPVSARYIRTGDLSAGSVEASATYTLNYE